MSSAGPDGDLVVPLRGHGAVVLDVGSKAASLDRAIASGLPVPPTVVLSTDAYRMVAETPGLSGLLRELSAAPSPPPAEHEEARRVVDEAFSDADLPERIAAAIAEAADRVRAEGGLLAARSSATAEDLRGTSFAGQYRSFLGLEEGADLERAVRLVWASLWHPAPRTYRRFHGIDDRGLAMAVIVMHQVPATSAGVAFSVDPGGQPDMVRVEEVTGLGEKLVSGRATPRVQMLPRDLDRGATTPRSSDVADLALRVESVFGEPQDLEWARDPEGLWLLQARPITTVDVTPTNDGFDTRDASSRSWTTSGVAEMLPGVLPPLRYGVCRLLVEESIRRHEGDLRNLPDVTDPRRLVGRVRGRAVLDADLLDRMRSGGKHVDEQRPWRRAVRLLRVRRRALWEAGTATVAALELLELIGDPADLDAGGLLSSRRRVLDLAGRAMAAEVAVASLAVESEKRLEATLGRFLETGDAARWARLATSRPGGTTAGWPGGAVRELLERTDPLILDDLAGHERWQSARESLESTGQGVEFLEDLLRIMATAGSMAVFAGPTWDEDLDQRWPVLRAAGGEAIRFAPDEGPTPLDDLLDGMAADPAWRRARILTAQVVDLPRLLIRRQAEDAADLLERRERVKSAVLTLGGVVRRIHLEAGRRLTEAGVLEEPDDVELLGESEFAGAVRALEGAGEEGRPSWAELARRRRWLATCEEAGPLPVCFEGVPETGPPPGATGDELSGWGASPGRLTGRARVLHSSTQPGLRRGEVMVATSTDASWAPLFMTAGAVVVEQGGPLSHAAIVARELGIPAVLNVPGVVARLERNECAVTVDGDSGTLVVHEATSDEGEGP